jgi:hypothetical protein
MYTSLVGMRVGGTAAPAKNRWLKAAQREIFASRWPVLVQVPTALSRNAGATNTPGSWQGGAVHTLRRLAAAHWRGGPPGEKWHQFGRAAEAGARRDRHDPRRLRCRDSTLATQASCPPWGEPGTRVPLPDARRAQAVPPSRRRASRWPSVGPELGRWPGRRRGPLRGTALPVRDHKMCRSQPGSDH